MNSKSYDYLFKLVQLRNGNFTNLWAVKKRRWHGFYTFVRCSFTYDILYFKTKDEAICYIDSRISEEKAKHKEIIEETSFP